MRRGCARARLGVGVAVTVAAIAIVACTSGATSDPGAGARMRIAKAQFVRGAMPAGGAPGPEVAAIVLPNNQIHAGFVNDPIGGALGPTATSAAIGLDGDEGYWIVPAGAPSVASPDDPSFDGVASFAADLAPGTYTLVVHGVDAQGAFGPARTQELTAKAGETVAPVGGAFVVTLTWDAEADLDLHVVDPLGNEISHRSPSSQPLFPSGDEPDAGASYGYLDFDSNANCVIDGRRQEDVLWPNPPPPGHYVIRVDTTSLCSAPIAHWTVTATLNGAALGASAGTSTDVDTRGPHDRGAGVTALEIDVP
jgi:hypothetical protein